MAKAWERQLGARVELNVEKQWARLTFENGSVDGAAIAKTPAAGSMLAALSAPSP